MKDISVLNKSALGLALFTVWCVAFAADEAPANSAHGIEMHHRPFDLVERTQHTLDRLESKLNLTEDQQSAWKTYADSTIARAKERAAIMEAHYTGKGSSNIDLDTASKMEKMVQALRARADRLQKVAQEMRALEGILSTDQKTIFDLYWKAHWQQRMHHHSAA